MIQLKQANNWLKQCKFRANKFGCYVNFDPAELPAIINHFDSKCAYCPNEATHFRAVFSMKNKAPCVPGNVLPCCDFCKSMICSRDIITYCKFGGIPQSSLKELLLYMLSRDKNGQLKQYIKSQLSKSKSVSQQKGAK